ncbi:acyl-CoA dehydrogenase family protein [Bartonella tamiae]|uniref:Acyl-CoA dehydrogenase n=1 Tax=Bartonella tamiae Th239 TaxID=1094558 RepID=J1JZN7_9HYPH|nr:acyl-CoA dehydrogenase family protein [Bartonella tamiae]EJF90597.1 hypothetical protein ME5_00998 [Bartonella tamiae Th239]EJF94025.1 hypothetical protein MEG_00883 [Bartonella tamiae Th307]
MLEIDAFYLRQFAKNAACAEKIGLTDDLALLKELGLFTACLPLHYGGKNFARPHDDTTTQIIFKILRQLGQVNLSLARLFEGHLNAIRLIDLYAAQSLREKIFNEVSKGALLGVWGADHIKKPLYFYHDTKNRIRLIGAKRFASGLGNIDYALVTLRCTKNDPDQMSILNVQDQTRQKTEEWKVSGMRATFSGVYDFSDLIIDPSHFIGKEGDLQLEPHFQGGIWRYCVAHLGGAESILQEWQTLLKLRNRLNNPFQLSRLAQAYTLVLGLAAFLSKVASLVEKASDNKTKKLIDDAVLAALLARENTENVCVNILNLCEKSLGMEAYQEHSALERMRRDLSLFIRQAAPDAKLLESANRLIERKGDLLW